MGKGHATSGTVAAAGRFQEWIAGEKPMWRGVPGLLNGSEVRVAYNVRKDLLLERYSR